ncbi:MAG: helix-turn-helix transcriptional regulator [Bacilli bacterium]|nr:helix-turn-helix transcriptional regulator [Bacilli bacterium]
MLRAILNSKNMSLYELEKASSISHATLNDIYNERSNINNCTLSIMSKLADALKMNIDELYKTLNYDNLSLFAYNSDFDLFKSDTLQRLKKSDESSFITSIIESKEIENYFFVKKYLESLYLLSLVDYLSNKNSIPLPEKYEQIRNYKCEKIYISKSIYLLLTLKQIKVTDIYKTAIKEFLKHNIVEAEKQNVV